MLVKDIMSTRLITVSPEERVDSAAKKLVSHNISGMIVVEEGKAVGVVTTNDIFRKVLVAGKEAADVEVREVMSSPVLSVHPLNSVEKAVKLMGEHRVRRLAVVNEANMVVGIVTVMDIVSHLPDLIKVMFQTWVKPDWR